MSDEFSLENQVKEYDMSTCLEMLDATTTDIENLFTGRNASLKMSEMKLVKESYKHTMERNLKTIHYFIKLLHKRMKELDEQRR